MIPRCQAGAIKLTLLGLVGSKVVVALDRALVVTERELLAAVRRAVDGNEVISTGSSRLEGVRFFSQFLMDVLECRLEKEEGKRQSLWARRADNDGTDFASIATGKAGKGAERYGVRISDNPPHNLKEIGD